MMVLISIIIYQSFLTIFFFSQINLRILGALIVILALKIIFSQYKDKIKECLAYYQTKFKDMELVNQKNFKVDNVCLKMYLKIKNDYNKK